MHLRAARSTYFPALVLIGLSSAAPCLTWAEVTADEVVANMRSAMGWDALSAGRGWEVRGSCEDHALEGTFWNLFTPDGRFAQHLTSEMRTVGGFDGEIAWMSDHSSMPRVLSFGARDEALGSSWVSSGIWLDPARPRFDVAVLKADSSDELIAVELQLKKRPWKAKLLVDRETWLPREFHRERSSGMRRVELSDWRAPHGFQIAHGVRITGVSGDVSTFSVESVGPMPTFIRDPFERVVARPQDASFDADAPTELEVRATESGHLLVHPRLDGEDVGWFLLDSGAGMNCVSPSVADRLGWERFGEVSVVGVGGAERGQFRRGGELSLGPVTMEGHPWLELDLSMLEPLFGVPVAGLIGYDLFARAVVVIDLAGPAVSVHDPAKWESPESARPLVLDETAPCVECTFAGGHSEWFRLDTGSDDTVSFHGPAVERLALTRRRDDLVRVSLAGVGGISQGDRGPVRWFELGGRKIEALQVTFMRPSKGALHEDYTAGNIGAGLMRNFRVAFDLSREEVSFLERVD